MNNVYLTGQLFEGVGTIPSRMIYSLERDQGVEGRNISSKMGILLSYLHWYTVLYKLKERKKG